MRENTCENCEFWKNKVQRSAGKAYRRCSSDAAHDGLIGQLWTRPTFGCVCWQEQEPTLKEMLVKYLTMTHRLSHVANDIDKQADTIMTMFEDYQKKS